MTQAKLDLQAIAEGAVMQSGVKCCPYCCQKINADNFTDSYDYSATFECPNCHKNFTVTLDTE